MKASEPVYYLAKKIITRNTNDDRLLYFINVSQLYNICNFKVATFAYSQNAFAVKA